MVRRLRNLSSAAWGAALSPLSRAGLLAIAILLGGATLAAQAACERLAMPAISDDFTPELAAIDSVDEAVEFVNHALGPGPHSQRVIADAADDLVRKRFFHGFSEYRPCDNWLAWLVGFVWRDLRNPVLPDEALRFRRGGCSQQAMVFQAIVERFGIEYGSVGFPEVEEPGSGHFVAAARVDGRWLLFDSDKEIPPAEMVPLSDVLAGGEVLERVYPNHGPGWREAARQGRVWFRHVNSNPAPQAALFHRLTGLASSYGWALFAVLFLLVQGLAMRRARRRARADCALPVAQARSQLD